MKNRITKRIALAKSEFRYTYMCLMAGDTTCLSRADRISIVIGITALFFAALSGRSVCYAGPIEQAGDIADNIMSSFRGVASKFALVALGACIIWFFMCTNDEDAKRPLKWGKRVILAYIIFMLLDVIIRFIDTEAGKMS